MAPFDFDFAGLAVTEGFDFFAGLGVTAVTFGFFRIKGGTILSKGLGLSSLATIPEGFGVFMLLSCVLMPPFGPNSSLTRSSSISEALLGLFLAEFSLIGEEGVCVLPVYVREVGGSGDRKPWGLSGVAFQNVSMEGT